MKLTAQDLREFKHINRVIVIWQNNVDELKQRLEYVDKVKGSNPEYPYQERGFVVEGMGDISDAVIAPKLERAKRELARFREIRDTVEDVRERIENPTDKLIFEYTIKGRSQQVIADMLSTSQSVISKRLTKIINTYFAKE